VSKEKELWYNTTTALDNEKAFVLGPYFSAYLRTDPKHLAFTLSRYKFVLKMLKENASVLELGCSDGLGSYILKERASKVHAVDFDHRAIGWAKENLEDSQITFEQENILTKKFGQFDTVISLDVIEHIYSENEDEYMSAILNNIKNTGVAIVGTPNITAEKYASHNDQHVNLFDGRRLVKLFEKHFHNVFLFGMNDEVIHTGYTDMCHYLFVMACHPIDK